MTTPQLETLKNLWHIAGLAPTSGYGTVALAATVASNCALVGTLTSVDFNDSGSTANAVEALLHWRESAIYADRCGLALVSITQE